MTCGGDGWAETHRLGLLLSQSDQLFSVDSASLLISSSGCLLNLCLLYMSDWYSHVIFRAQRMRIAGYGVLTKAFSWRSSECLSLSRSRVVLRSTRCWARICSKVEYTIIVWTQSSHHSYVWTQSSHHSLVHTFWIWLSEHRHGEVWRTCWGYWNVNKTDFSFSCWQGWLLLILWHSENGCITVLCVIPLVPVPTCDVML